MIGWEDIYKVVVAMLPLYFALVLGYGSVKWWRIFTPEQCDAINQFVCFFTLPLFTFEFTANVDPFNMNYLFIGADAISKFIIVVVLAFWAKCSSKGSYCWSITSFSLSTLTNSLVVGVPLLSAMYGQIGVDLVVQASVIQAIIWLTVLLFVLEFRRSGTGVSSTTTIDASRAVSGETGKDLEGNEVVVTITRPSFWHLMRMVWMKLAMNPNSYACIVGLVWAFIANRCHFKMPKIMEGSILIMSKAGTGTAMFSMGLFMAMQEKFIACGPSLTLFGMVLRFIAGPAAMAIGAIAVGLHGDVLRVAIIQAALPQSITSFIFAKEYGLHANVLSTAVIFGMIASLPVLVTQKTLFRGANDDGLYKFSAPSTSSSSLHPSALATERVLSDCWHGRLGHPHSRVLRQILKSNNLPCSPPKLSSLCSACQLEKCSRLSLSVTNSVSSTPLDLIFTDVWELPQFCLVKAIDIL